MPIRTLSMAFAVRLCLVLFGLTVGTARPALSAELPQVHEYQKTLRDYLASLTAKDFELEVRPIQPPPAFRDWQKYQCFVMGRHYHWTNLIAATMPAESFTLAAIESTGSTPLFVDAGTGSAWLVQGGGPGNPYRNSRPLKLRIFVMNAVDLMMHDQLHESGDRSASRSDFLGGTLIWLIYNYTAARDALPENVQAAYEAGLKKMIYRLRDWGPTGAMTDMDLFAAVSLGYAAKLFDKDPEIGKLAESYSRMLFTDPRFFHPAGYFVDCGCYDVSYNGISLYFCAWAAAENKWDFAKSAIDRAYELRNYMSLPDPDGNCYGPTHMSSRTSGDAPHDQWNWNERHNLAALSTDHAFASMTIPPAAQFDSAGTQLIEEFNSSLKGKPDSSVLKPWTERHWTGAPLSPYERLDEPFFRRFLKLAKEKSPLLTLPFRRPDKFIRNFGDALVVAKQDKFGAIIHTGPVTGEHPGWNRPHGYGGGTLSAFWTPATGSVVLGRRRGVQGAKWDTIEEWRERPVHAVSGRTTGDKVFSSARIQRPTVKIETSDRTAEVVASGTIPQSDQAQGQILAGTIDYQRTFELDQKGLRVQTTVTGDGRDALAEVYEIIPVFLRELGYQPTVTPTAIEFLRNGKWFAASTEPSDKVSAVRLKRFTGAVLINFESPQTVKLSSADWTDGYQSQATCRNLLIELPTQSGKSWTATINWRIQAQ